MISWNKCKKDFQWDGSLRDIYITPATISDWRAVYSLLHDYSEVEYSVDNVVKPAPPSVEEIFSIRPLGNPMFRFRAGRTLVVFHFFSDEEIECDVDPREITSQTDLDGLLSYVRQLGNATRKPVIITPENKREESIITYSPLTKDFRYHENSD